MFFPQLLFLWPFILYPRVVSPFSAPRIFQVFLVLRFHFTISFSISGGYCARFIYFVSQKMSDFFCLCVVGVVL